MKELRVLIEVEGQPQPPVDGSYASLLEELLEEHKLSTLVGLFLSVFNPPVDCISRTKTSAVETPLTARSSTTNAPCPSTPVVLVLIFSNGCIRIVSILTLLVV
jgi:hypothetical protein